MSSLFRWERQKKRFLKLHFEFVYYSCFLIHLELKQHIPSYTCVVSSKTISDSRPKWRNLDRFSDRNGAKTLSEGAAHTYVAYIRNPPPPLLLAVTVFWLQWSRLFICQILCRVLNTIRLCRSIDKIYRSQSHIGLKFGEVILCSLELTEWKTFTEHWTFSTSPKRERAECACMWYLRCRLSSSDNLSSRYQITLHQELCKVYWKVSSFLSCNTTPRLQPKQPISRFLAWSLLFVTKI